jgi:hypothetical protein
VNADRLLSFSSFILVVACGSSSPIRHGHSTVGNEVLRGYQVSGWRFFDVGKMGQLRSTPEMFSKNRHDHAARDRAMQSIHC